MAWIDTDTGDPHDDAPGRAGCGSEAQRVPCVTPEASTDEAGPSVPLGSRIAARFAAVGGLPHDLPELREPVRLPDLHPPRRRAARAAPSPATRRRGA